MHPAAGLLKDDRSSETDKRLSAIHYPVMMCTPCRRCLDALHTATARAAAPTDLTLACLFDRPGMCLASEDGSEKTLGDVIHIDVTHLITVQAEHGVIGRTRGHLKSL